MKQRLFQPVIFLPRKARAQEFFGGFLAADFRNAREADHNIVGIAAKDCVDVAAVERVFRPLHDLERFVARKSLVRCHIHQPRSCVAMHRAEK
jgi:hypothetical protein